MTRTVRRESREGRESRECSENSEPTTAGPRPCEFVMRCFGLVRRPETVIRTRRERAGTHVACARPESPPPAHAPCTALGGGDLHFESDLTGLSPGMVPQTHIADSFSSTTPPRDAA